MVRCDGKLGFLSAPPAADEGGPGGVAVGVAELALVLGTLVTLLLGSRNIIIISQLVHLSLIRPDINQST